MEAFQREVAAFRQENEQTVDIEVALLAALTELHTATLTRAND